MLVSHSTEQTCFASRQLDRSDHRTPGTNHKPDSRKSISKGTQIFTAAIPSLPTPCPTNIPSIAVTADILSIPSNVGTKYFRNNVNTFSVLKSIASLFMFNYIYRLLSCPKAKKCRIK